MDYNISMFTVHRGVREGMLLIFLEFSGTYVGFWYDDFGLGVVG